MLVEATYNSIVLTSKQHRITVTASEWVGDMLNGTTNAEVLREKVKFEIVTVLRGIRPNDMEMM